MQTYPGEAQAVTEGLEQRVLLQKAGEIRNLYVLPLESQPSIVHDGHKGQEEDEPNPAGQTRDQGADHDKDDPGGDLVENGSHQEREALDGMVPDKRAPLAVSG